MIHAFSKGVARYMEVYFQREAYFNPIVKALAEEFVVVTLLAMCSVDMRQWHRDHDPGPDGPRRIEDSPDSFLSSPTSPNGKAAARTRSRVTFRSSGGPSRTARWPA